MTGVFSMITFVTHILAHVYFNKFPITSIFFCKIENGEPAKVWYSAPMHHMSTTVELLRQEMPDLITAPDLWLFNLLEFSSVDYRILAVLEE